MSRLKQAGFSALELLLILLAIALIGGTGWYVWQNKDDSSPESESSSSQNEAATEEESAADPTADWATYKSTGGIFTLKHPKTWVTSSDCEDNPLFLAPTKEQLGSCNSENGGTVAISTMTESYEKQPDSDYANTAIYKEYKKTVVKVNGVDATRRQWVQGTTESGFGDDMIHINYEIIGPNNTVLASYTASQQDKAEQDIFDTMIGKTLVFE